MFMALIINMIYAKAIGLTQGSIGREVGSDMWLSTFFSVGQGLLAMFLIVMIIRRLPDQDMIGQSEKLLGKWFAKIISLVLFGFFLFGYAGVIVTFVYHLNNFFLPDAPILLFVVAAIIIGVYGIFFGIEVIARLALAGVFSAIVLNILIIMGSLSEFDIRELLPTFQSGFIPTVWASRYHNTDWALATMMAAIILPLVREKEKWGKSGFAGIAFAGLFVIIWPILEVGVLSAEVTAQYKLSCMQLARSAHIGLFFHRYEMIMVAFFALSNITQIMMSLLCASVTLQKMLGLKDYRPAIIPTSLILGGFSYWIVFDHRRAIEFIENTWVLYAMATAIGLPIILLGLGTILKKKLK